MKYLNISRVCLAAALVLGSLVLCFGTSPATTEADGFIGGFYPRSASSCCYHDHTGWCTAAAENSDNIAGSMGCTKAASLLWCHGNSSGDKSCGPELAIPPCTKVGDPLKCNITFNGKCD